VVKLVISVDVEEEGLFSGRYPRRPPGVKNVAALSRLEFIPREFGVPLTLLLSYQVAVNSEARPILEQWQKRHGAEIGAHLHHWNTPPFSHPTAPEPLASRELGEGVVEAKLQTLVETIGRNFGSAPRSFRMGRFDWWPAILELLPAAGLNCDSSMVPLAHYVGRVDQFQTPSDPFRLTLGHQPQALVEVPLTMIPVFPRLARLFYRFAKTLPPPRGEKMLASFRTFGAAGIHPAMFPLPSMRLAAHLHRRRGGRVLNMFLHSSELHPGATPHYPTEAAVGRLTDKIRAFLTWLARTGPVAGTTLAQLGDEFKNHPLTLTLSPLDTPRGER
jgi:hypothetical protein